MDLPKDKIDIFSRMLDYKTNDKIEAFIKDKIGLEKYSFHQAQIFIKLFISQYSKFDGKLKFTHNGKDVTDECIQEFANCTKYFTSGGFAKLLNETNIDKKIDYIDLISNIYNDDLKSTKFEIPLIFIMVENKYNYFDEKCKQKLINKEDLPISMILFDELGLSEKSKTNPLKVLHSKLEYGGKKDGVSFVGISNYSLDAAKINRALILSVPNLEDRIDELKTTVQSIVESISDDLYKNQKQVFNILSMAYFEYKNNLFLIKELTAFKEFNIQNSESKEPIDLTNIDFSEIRRIKKFIDI